MNCSGFDVEGQDQGQIFEGGYCSRQRRPHRRLGVEVSASLS